MLTIKRISGRRINVALLPCQARQQRGRIRERLISARLRLCSSKPAERGYRRAFTGHPGSARIGQGGLAPSWNWPLLNAGGQFQFTRRRLRPSRDLTPRFAGLRISPSAPCSFLHSLSAIRNGAGRATPKRGVKSRDVRRGTRRRHGRPGTGAWARRSPQARWGALGVHPGGCCAPLGRRLHPVPSGLRLPGPHRDHRAGARRSLAHRGRCACARAPGGTPSAATSVLYGRTLLWRLLAWTAGSWPSSPLARNAENAAFAKAKACPGATRPPGAGQVEACCMREIYPDYLSINVKKVFR